MLLCALPFALACDALPGTDYDYAAGNYEFGQAATLDVVRGASGVWESEGVPRKIAIVPFKEKDGYSLKMWHLLTLEDQATGKPAANARDLTYVNGQFRALTLEGAELVVTEGSPTSQPAGPLEFTRWKRSRCRPSARVMYASSWATW